MRLLKKRMSPRLRSDELPCRAGLFAIIFIAAILVSGCPARNAGGYSGDKKIAIVSLRNISRGAADEKMIRGALADALKNIDGIDVMNIDDVDKLLNNNGRSTSQTILSVKDLDVAGADLKADGIFFGNITTYHIPSDQEKTSGSFVPLCESVAKIEVILRYYDCSLKKVTWTCPIIGYSKLIILKIESFGVNMEAAIGRFKEDFIRKIKKQKAIL